MHNTTKKTLLITLCIASFGSVGCTTMESMHGTQEALVEEKIRVGDKVFLHYNDGTSLQIEITEIGAEAVSGADDYGKKVVANYEELDSVGHKEIEVLKTTAATVGIIALSPLLIVGLIATGGGM